MSCSDSYFECSCGPGCGCGTKIEQKQMEPVQITPDMTDAQADVLGVMGFSFAMNQKLTDKRNTGDPKYLGWHRPKTAEMPFTIQEFKDWAKRCIDEDRYVDAANLLMMGYHRSLMEKK